MEASLSVIIPCFNAESFIKKNLEQLNSYLSTLNIGYEIIAVDDGSFDKTREVLASLNLSSLRILSQESNKGKFSSIKEGVQEAKGKVIIFTDSDLPYDLSAISYTYSLLAPGNIHLVVGDRTLPGAVYEQNLQIIRKVCTRVLRFIVRLISLGGIFDSQCGFKGIESSCAKAIFPLIQEDRFAGDIELLYIALKYNLIVRRIPVRLQRAEMSSVHATTTSLEIIKCLFSLKYRHLRGQYSSTALSKLSAQSYWQTSMDK